MLPPPSPPLKVSGKRSNSITAQVGNVVEGRITAVKDFGAFMDIGLAQHALIHTAQISEARVNSVAAVFKEGDYVKASRSAPQAHCPPRGHQTACTVTRG